MKVTEEQFSRFHQSRLRRQSAILLLVNLFFKTICRNRQIKSRRPMRVLAALLAGLCLGALTIHAQDATWSGVGGGSAFGLWNERENWKMPAEIPTGTAIFNTD